MNKYQIMLKHQIFCVCCYSLWVLWPHDEIYREKKLCESLSLTQQTMGKISCFSTLTNITAALECILSLIELPTFGSSQSIAEGKINNNWMSAKYMALISASLCFSFLHLSGKQWITWMRYWEMKPHAYRPTADTYIANHQIMYWLDWMPLSMQINVPH